MRLGAALVLVLVGCEAAPVGNEGACGDDAVHQVGTVTLSGADADAQAEALCDSADSVDELVVSGTSWTDLSAVDCLCGVGSLTLESNPDLVSTEPVRVVAGEVEGVRVVGSPLLDDLAAYAQVTGFSDLHLQTLGLGSLSGLGAATRLDVLTLVDMPALASLDDLAEEVQVGSLVIQSAADLEAVGDWSAPRSIEALTVSGTAIETLAGLADADSLTQLVLVSNPSLSDLTGYPRATVSPLALSIGDSAALSSLSPLRGVTQLDSLALSGLADSATLAGLEDLAMVGGVSLAGFPHLQDLAGLGGLRYLTSTGLHLEVHDEGPDLTDLSALHELQGVAGGITITGPVSDGACLALWEHVADLMDPNEFQCGAFAPE